MQCVHVCGVQTSSRICYLSRHFRNAVLKIRNEQKVSVVNIHGFSPETSLLKSPDMSVESQAKLRKQTQVRSRQMTNPHSFGHESTKVLTLLKLLKAQTFHLRQRMH